MLGYSYHTQVNRSATTWPTGYVMSRCSQWQFIEWFSPRLASNAYGCVWIWALQWRLLTCKGASRERGRINIYGARLLQKVPRQNDCTWPAFGIGPFVCINRLSCAAFASKSFEAVAVPYKKLTQRVAGLYEITIGRDSTLMILESSVTRKTLPTVQPVHLASKKVSTIIMMLDRSRRTALCPELIARSQRTTAITLWTEPANKSSKITELTTWWAGMVYHQEKVVTKPSIRKRHAWKVDVR